MCEYVWGGWDGGRVLSAPPPPTLKWILKEYDGRVWTWYRPLVGFCEHGAEPASSKSAGNFLLQNSDSNNYSIDCIGLDLFNFYKF